MKMNLKILFCILLFPLVAQCQEKPNLTFEVLVKDDEGKPIAGCDVWAQTFLKWEPGQGFGKDFAQEFTEKTNEEGVASFHFPSVKGDLKLKPLAPNGFYKNHIEEHQFREVVEGEWKVDPRRFEITLKRIKNPVPLYARSMTRSFAKVKIPELGKPCGFDLIESDWVAPHGQGKVADLIFSLKKNYKNVYDFECELSISFSNEKNGFFQFDREVNQGSQLRLSYLSPEDGFKGSITKLMAIEPISKKMRVNISDKANYFLRLRSVVNKHGELQRANYAKIHGDFRFDPINSETALLNFDYYMNPTPNDRNLEFDLSRNLLTDKTKTDKVINP